MSKSLNVAHLIGNLGRDPEKKVTQGGTSVTKFSLATTSRYKDRSDQWQDRTEWHNIVAWSRLADIAAEYLHKGSKVYVQGSIQTSSWDDKNGEKKYKTEIVADEIIMLDSKSGTAQSEPREEVITEESEVF